MKNKRWGFTLIEILVALAISVVAMTFAIKLMKNFSDLYTRNREVLENETEMMFIRNEVKKYFRRAIGAAVTQNTPPGATVNFLSAGSGAMVLVSDLRPCTGANPFNPLNSALPGNRSQVRFSCCGRNQVMVANVPLGGGTVNITSQCRASNGLSVEVVRNGAVEQTRCFPNIAEMDIALAGFSDLTQSNIYYWNLAIPSGLSFGGNNAIGDLRSRFQLYLTPGFAGQQEAVVCQEPAGFGV